MGGAGWYWLIVVFSMGFGIVYSTFTKYSNNLVLDNLIYNALIVVTVTAVLAHFGLAKSFGLFQWLGVCIINLGIILFNWR